MGTSNFLNKNASKVFAVMLEDGWGFEDLFFNLKYALESRDYGIHATPASCQPEDNYNRSFSGTEIGGKGESKMFGDIEVYVGIIPIIRSGYYQGVNLDWDLMIQVGGFEADKYEIDDICRFDGNMNVGMAKIQTRNIQNWIDRTKETLVDELEQVFKEHSQPLVVTARFSNGETMYAKA